MTAIPGRRALVHFHEPQTASRVERVLESAHFLRFFAFAVPTMTVVMVVPPSAISGIIQRRLWSHWDLARAGLQSAIESGWTPTSLEFVGEQLLEIEAQNSRLNSVSKWVFGAYLFWASLFLVVSFEFSSVRRRC